jgi:hypothetical protein
MKWSQERRRQHLESYPAEVVDKAYKLFERFVIGP